MKKRIKMGDRKDGIWLRDADAMHTIMPFIFPNRCDNEAFISEKIDLTNVNAYLEKKNAENPEYKYSLFQVIVTATMKTIMMRPNLNRFIIGKRIYLRNDFSAAFIVKKAFTDNGDEAIAVINFEDESNIDWFNKKLHDIVHSTRNTDKKDSATDTMEFFKKLPRFLITFIIKIINILNYYGKVPDFITKGDLSYATCMFSNLGSIGLKAGYHHLYNWGTNSIFVVIGEKKESHYFDNEGNVKKHETLEMGFTIDERLADGYYYSKSFKLLRYLLQHPEELEKPMMGEVNDEWKCK